MSGWKVSIAASSPAGEGAAMWLLPIGDTGRSRIEDLEDARARKLESARPIEDRGLDPVRTDRAERIDLARRVSLAARRNGVGDHADRESLTREHLGGNALALRGPVRGVEREHGKRAEDPGIDAHEAEEPPGVIRVARKSSGYRESRRGGIAGTPERRNQRPSELPCPARESPASPRGSPRSSAECRCGTPMTPNSRRSRPSTRSAD